MTVTRRRSLGLMATAGVAAAGPALSQAAVRARRGTYRTRGIERPVVVLPEATHDGPMSGTTLLLLHGAGGFRSDSATFYANGLRLADLGYRVVMPDYFSGAPDAAQTDNVRWWAEAVEDAAAWAKGLPGPASERLVAMGYSRGGYLAGEVAVRTSEIEAVVGVASAGNVTPRDIVRRPPVLLIHAAHDPVIPPNRTRRWARILREKGVAVDMIELPLSRHGFNPEEWRGIFDSADAFFRRTKA